MELVNSKSPTLKSVSGFTGATCDST